MTVSKEKVTLTVRLPASRAYLKRVLEGRASSLGVSLNRLCIEAFEQMAKCDPDKITLSHERLVRSPRP